MKTPVDLLFGLFLFFLIHACGEANSDGQWKTLAEHTNKGQYQAPNPAIIYKSEVFTLSDKPARIVYDYTSPMPGTGGAFSVFIIEEGKDPLIDGAMPQVMVGIGADKGTQTVQFTPPGKYYLEISGMGDWEVRLDQVQ